jgi:hypothetical protein
MAANGPHRHDGRERFAGDAEHIFVAQHGTVFPGVFREKAAPQPAGLQQLVFALANMLVMVCG